MPHLQTIAAALDSKIRACLVEGQRTHFWFASFPGAGLDRIEELHALGFDNYPLAPIRDPYPILFFEKIFGCEICVQDRSAPSFFNTWPIPRFNAPAELAGLPPDLEAQPAWREYLAAVDDYLAATPPPERLSVAAKAFCPLDLACNLCGAENVFVWMHEAPAEIRALFDGMADLYLAARRRLLKCGARLVNGRGFPGLTCSDLQLPSISPDMIRRFILPCYAKVARACGGAFVGCDWSDPDLLEEVMHCDWVLGGSCDRRLSPAEIRRSLGRKILVLPYYAYDDTLDRPTPRDGLYWNPIVQCHSRDAEAVYREIGRQGSLAIYIERPSLAEVIAVRKRMESAFPINS
jgi:hypothetical protein